MWELLLELFRGGMEQQIAQQQTAAQAAAQSAQLEQIRLWFDVVTGNQKLLEARLNHLHALLWWAGIEGWAWLMLVWYFVNRKLNRVLAALAAVPLGAGARAPDVGVGKLLG